MIDSVRTRLVLVNVVVLAVLQAIFAIALYQVLSWSLIAQQDAALKTFVESTSREVAAKLAESGPSLPPGDLVWAGKRYSATDFALYGAEGALLSDKPAGTARLTPLPADWRSLAGADRYYTVMPNAAIEKGGRRLVARRLDVPQFGGAVYIVISRPIDPLLAQLKVVGRFLAAAVPILLTVSALGGWFVTRHSLAPVAAMSEEARRLNAGDMEERLPVSNPRDELGQLAVTLNGLLDRVGTALSHQREFMTEAAHQLRTPISVVRTATAVTLGQPTRAEAEYREALGLIEAQLRHLTRIVEDMFLLARADGGFHGLRHEALYLNELVKEAVQLAEILAVEKGIDLEAANASDAPCRGDEELLRQMVLNLLENAIKYTPRGGTVRIALHQGAEGFVIDIADDGAPIPLPYRERIFERFFRVPETASESEAPQNGAGLGLPIARWIAEAHGGSLVLAESRTGNLFRITLPI